MDACINWVVAMVEAGHTYTELKVAEPWAQALVDGSDTVPGIDPLFVSAPDPGKEFEIELVTASGSFFAVLSG
tara:strand:+ start:7318 stop:7536 length:219 start_codon:yes stop_codon:yes gene_type:complete